MTRAAALVALLIATLAPPVAAHAHDDDPAPAATVIVRGVLLTSDSAYIVFTTGDAVLLAPNLHVPAGAAMGRTVRVTIDPVSRKAVAIELDPGMRQPGEIDANALPRDLVAVDPRTAQASPGASGSTQSGTAAGTIAVTIAVRVPDDTPPTDDVYLATDRTNYGAAELRMNRVDAHAWTVTLPLGSGTTLRYMFTRGSYASVEREPSGAIKTPRSLTAAPGSAQSDTVARWADST